MPHKHLTLVVVAAIVAAIDIVTHTQADQKKFDPHNQGAKVGGKFDPYQQGARAGDRFDPYSQGANKNDSTASAFNPGTQPANVEKGKYDTYTQDARVGDRFGPYSQGVKTGSRFDPYSEGANKRDTSKQ